MTICHPFANMLASHEATSDIDTEEMMMRMIWLLKMPNDCAAILNDQLTKFVLQMYAHQINIF